jgi:hypothetical protein
MLSKKLHEVSARFNGVALAKPVFTFATSAVAAAPDGWVVQFGDRVAGVGDRNHFLSSAAKRK